MNKVHPKKLLHSKWTAVSPLNKEKHFMVTSVEFDDDNNVIDCVVEAVMSKNEYQIAWRDLNNISLWRQGWK